MQTHPRPRPFRYVVPVFAVALVVGARMALLTTLGTETPFRLFFAGVLISAWYGGLGPGLLGGLLAAAASNFFFLEPRYSFGIESRDDLLRYSLFVIEAVFITILGGRMQQARTAAERNYAQARQLQQELLSATENERQRVGRDLHDGVGQVLTGTALLSQALSDRLASRGAPEALDAQRVVELVNQSVAQMRGLARGLAPVEMTGLGLRQALVDMAKQTSQISTVDCVCHAEEVPELDPTTALHLYRIAQEAVSNAIRHGEARNISIVLRRSRKTLQLRIANDGRPFVANPKPGMGLRIMEHRATIINGQLEIGTGTDGLVTVNVELLWPAKAPVSPASSATH